MNEEIKKFLESSMLEEYVLGIIEKDKIPMVERIIQENEAIRLQYEELQSGMQALAQKMAIPPPPGLRGQILDNLDSPNIVHPSPEPVSPKGFPSWLGIAACVAAIALSIWALGLSNERTQLQRDLSQAKLEYTDLEKACATQQKESANQLKRLMLIADVNTQRILLEGNDKAPDFKSYAYWNPVEQQSYLHLASLPKLPQGKCLQLWADVDGKMVNIDVLPNIANQTIPIPFKANATSLNITIEPAGGSPSPTVADLVAHVSI